MGARVLHEDRAVESFLLGDMCASPPLARRRPLAAYAEILAIFVLWCDLMS